MSRTIAVLAAIVLSTSCGVKHIRTLSDAEVIFNRAADSDNRSRFDAPGGILNSAGALADYRMAARMLDDLIKTQTANLKQDNLLCTAIALQGLSKWRSGDQDAAINAVRGAEAQACTTATAAQTAPRDAALIRAVPGLVRIDQANAKVDNGKPGDEPDIEQLIGDAHKDLIAAAALVSTDSPVREYLIVSHLAAARVLQQSIVSENLPIPSPDFTRVNTTYKAAAACWLGRYDAMAGLNGANYKQRIAIWKDLLATQPDIQKCAN